MTSLFSLKALFETHTRYWLLAILLLAFGLRLYRLDTHGIFFDEKATMLVSQGIVQDGANQKDVFDKGKLIFTNQEFWRDKKLADYYEAMTRSDIGNSPFYYFLLHQWMNVFGISDFSARSMSVLFSALTVLMIFIFTRHFFKSNQIALLAALLTSVEPFFVAYAQQARNYSLTFFLTLLATYYFLRAIEADELNKPSRKWYIFYGLTAFFGLYSHFLVASVLIAHGLYLLLFVRKWRSWAAAGLAVAFAGAGLGWWLTYGGGQWTLFSLNHQSKVYLECALNRPYNNPYGIILPATIQNVAMKSLPIFSDMWIFANGIWDKIEGKKNVLLTVITGFLMAGAFYQIRRTNLKNPLLLYASLSLLLTEVIVFRTSAIPYLILSMAVTMLMLSLWPLGSDIFSKNNEVGNQDNSLSKEKYLWFLLIMAIVPTGFLIFNAFRAGHTYGLTQRYSGFSFPYLMILASVALWRLGQSKHWLKYVIGAIIMIQMVFVANTLRKIYEDRSVKYNYRETPREPNPHYAAAQKALSIYQQGDTLILPAPMAKFDNPMDKTYLPYSVVDAQYFNLYLPKEGIFVQKLDTVNVQHIRLKKASGQLVELMNLEGKRY